MLENEIRHAAVCEEINRVYKQGSGEEFYEAFHSFHDRNDAMEMARNLLGMNLDMFKKMSRNLDFNAARSALVVLSNLSMMIIIELDNKPIWKDNHGELCKELQELYHRKNLLIMGTASICPSLRKCWQCPASDSVTSICVSKFSLAARSSGFRMNRSETRLSTWPTTAL